MIAPYPLSTPVADIAAQALTDQGIEAMKQRVTEVVRNRTYLADALKNLPNVEQVYCSETNYILVKFTDADCVFRSLWIKGLFYAINSVNMGWQVVYASLSVHVKSVIA